MRTRLQVESVGSHDSPEGTRKNEEKGGKTPPKRDRNRIKRNKQQRKEKRRMHARVHTHNNKMI
jgi:hypothetical protein